jgi:hypothetical protein
MTTCAWSEAWDGGYELGPGHPMAPLCLRLAQAFALAARTG